MYVVPVAMVVGAAVGLLLGGSVRHVRPSRIAAWPLVAVTLVSLLAVSLPIELPRAAFFLGVSLLLGMVTCAVNVHLPGTVIVMAGIGANLLVLALNGHVPVDPDALVSAGIVAADALGVVELGNARALETDDSLLPILGAVLPLRAIGEVFSFGDLIVAAGLANIGFRLVRPERARIRRIERIERIERAEASYDRRVIDLTDTDLSTVPTIPQLPARPMVTIAGEAEHGSDDAAPPQ